MLIFLLLFIIVVGVNGKYTCKEVYEEFILEDGYNKNLEPPTDLLITDSQKVHDIEEVKHVKYSVEKCVVFI